MVKMIIDEKFYNNFNKKIAQVFMYIIDECNLRCIHCLYKPELSFQLKKKRMTFNDAVNLMKCFLELGASKITFMGGEPTLYNELPKLIHIARNMGYSYIRIDTNGTFDSSLLDNNFFKELDEITFSLDGYNQEINDSVRGKGTFNNCVNNIKKAVSKGFEVHITTCIHDKFTKIDRPCGMVNLIKMIEFAKTLGIKIINMHDLFKSGVPRDLWSGNINTSIEEYLEVFSQVLKYKKHEKEILIRMPQCVISEDEFNINPEYYGYCSVKHFDRILAFPNGMLRLCSILIGTPYCVGYYDDTKIYWNSTPTNETLDHKMNINTPCTNQIKGGYFNNKYVPLCVSFKPKQKELVWNEILKWEDRRKNEKPRS